MCERIVKRLTSNLAVPPNSPSERVIRNRGQLENSIGIQVEDVPPKPKLTVTNLKAI
jgi:hypothetical protein